MEYDELNFLRNELLDLFSVPINEVHFLIRFKLARIAKQLQ